MKKDIPKDLLKTEYRKEMWRNAKKIADKIEKIIPISKAYVMGSFIAKKIRPADVDFIMLLKTPEKKKNAEWALDLVIVPDNKYGESVLADDDKWVKQRYREKSVMIRVK